MKSVIQSVQRTKLKSLMEREEAPLVIIDSSIVIANTLPDGQLHADYVLLQLSADKLQAIVPAIFFFRMYQCFVGQTV
jgi:hypothetical protein